MATRASGSKQRGKGFEVRLDLTEVEEGAEPQDLQVVLQFDDGTTTSETVGAAPGSETSVSVATSEKAGGARLLVGPATATVEELLASETISIDVSAAELERGAVLLPIRIAPYFWYWWLRWCREFVVRGRVVCRDGSPVPAAEVCAFDVDRWWWWSSTQQVGCATTDVNGAFEIRFRWCCNLGPWWWWRQRVWAIDPRLSRQIRDVIDQDPRLELGRTDNRPSLAAFDRLLAEEGLATTRALTPDAAPGLEPIRQKLLAKLPPAPHLAALHIWPWWPWWPWRDCTPDLIFRVTQDCERPGTVLVDEDPSDARWNVPNPLDVVLVANDLACCRPRTCPDPPCRPSRCLSISTICGASVEDIGGNVGTPGPDGYLYPGAVVPGTAAYNGDRPFAGTVTIDKANVFLGVDYYEIEVDSGAGFGPLPPGAAVSFSRHWLQPPNPPGPPWAHGDVPFPFTTMSGHEVVESREHYEAVTGLPPGAFWTLNADLLAPIDSTKLADGTHRFRVVGWTDGGGGTIVDPVVLPVCDSEIENGWVLTFDNRLDPDPAHPTVAGTHPCVGTVHSCVTEPDTDVIAVRVNGIAVAACATVDAAEGVLEVDFLASDPDAHLATYSLVATYGENLVVNLLDRPSAVITELSPGSADFVGPTYGQALGQGAAAPSWRGGTYRLSVDVREAFPEPCCYQLELRAWKRTVVDCSVSFAHHNLTEYTIGVGVCPPRDDRDLRPIR